jgi:hypothetical protein
MLLSKADTALNPDVWKRYSTAFHPVLGTASAANTWPQATHGEEDSLAAAAQVYGIVSRVFACFTDRLVQDQFFCDPGKHPGADFLAIMERKDIVRIIIVLKRPM